MRDKLHFVKSEVGWDPGGFASGLYSYRLQARSQHSRDGQAGEFVEAKKLLLLK